MNKEMLLLVDTLARERDLPSSEVFQAIEESMAFAVKKEIGGEPDIRVEIDDNTGDWTIFRCWEIVDDVDFQTNLDSQVLRPDAPDEFQADKSIDYYEEIINDEYLGRQAVQLAKQAIGQKLKEAEQRVLFDKISQDSPQLYMASVKGFQKNGVLLEAGRLELLMPRTESLPKDKLKINDRIKVAIKGKEKISGRDVIIASRTCPSFMELLLAEEVVQIDDGSIEILKIARIPGVRSKILIRSHLRKESSRKNESSDRSEALRIVVGNKGLHAKNISDETGGEAIDVIEYTSDLGSLITRLFAKEDIEQIRIDEETKLIQIVVPDEQLGRAIGQKGSNIKLISDLIEWNIDVLNQEQWEEKEQARLQRIINLFESKLDVDTDVAKELVENNFESLEEIALCDIKELFAIEAFDTEVIDEIRNRAKNQIMIKQTLYGSDIANASKELSQIVGIKSEEIEALTKAEIYNITALADLATDELLELIPYWKKQRAEALIMAARAIAFVN